MTDSQPFLLRAQQIESSLQTFSHSWNPKSEIIGTYLGRSAGLTRTGVNLAKPARILRFKSWIEARDELRESPIV